MTIDLLTLNLALVLMQVLQSLGWLALYLGLRRMPGIRFIMLGSLAATLGTLLHPMREVLSPFAVIWLANILLLGGQAVVMVGIAQLIERPQLRWLAGAAILFTTLLWPLMLGLAPDNLSIRIAAWAFVVGVIVCAAGLNMLHAQRVPRGLRWTMAALELTHGGLSLLRALEAVLAPPRDNYLAMDAVHTAWFLEIFIFGMLHFIGLVAVVGSRMLAELTERNQALAEEVEARRTLQKQLAAALEQEGAMRREQRLFIDMVGHDFRTPVAVIDRAAEMLQTLLPEAAQSVAQRLAAIRGAGRSLRRLIDTFLANEQLEGGLNAGRRQPVALRPLLQGLRADMAQLGPDRLQLDVEPGAEGLAALGDPDWLATVCANLIDNALKYSGDDNIVLLRLGRQGDQAVLSVVDSGMGIPAADLARIGDRFFRGSNGARAKGTGLGLHAARRLVEALGGELKLYSEPGEGTVAEIRLPLADFDKLQQMATK